MMLQQDLGSALTTQTLANQGLTAGQTLTLLLTTESLLFAAFNVAAGLIGPTAGGRQLSAVASWVITLLVGCTLLLVAIGAGLAWWQVFGEAWPESTMRQIEGLAALGGIVVQPVIAGVVVYATRP